MHGEICGLSAFRLHRTPSPVRSLLPPFPDLSIKPRVSRILKHVTVMSTSGLPIHTLIDGPNKYHCSRALCPHVWRGELPSGAIWHDDELDVDYASPLFTLLTLAPSVSVFHLAMAAFELCGSFAVYKPSKEMQVQIDQLERQRLIWPSGWKQVKDHAGKPTSLWKRDPLIELDELHRFVRDTAGMRGNVKLAKAASMVTGVCASPLEVQASMLFGLSRRMGGEGLGPFTNNRRIPLSHTACKLAGQSTCYADLFFEANDQHGDIDVELQGHLIHDGGAAGGVDANRALALQSMGIDVILLTSEQLSNRGRFEETAAYLANRLGITRKPKTPAMMQRASELRADLFIDWETLGAPGRSTARKRSSR